MKRSLLLVLLFPYFLVNAQFENHGPDEVYYTNDLIKGKNDRLFLSTTSGLYVSDNKGDTWKRSGKVMSDVYSEPRFTINQTTQDLYAWDRDGTYYYTSDNGETWTWQFVSFSTSTSMSCIAVDSPDTVWIGTNKGLFYAIGTDLIKHPIAVDALNEKNITSLYAHDKTVIAGTKLDGVFMSFDGGKHWEPSSSGLPSDFGEVRIYASGNIIFVYNIWNGIYRSDDNGLHWTEQNDKSVNNQINDVFVDGDMMYLAVNSFQNVYKTPVSGGPWKLIDNGVADDLMQTIFADGDLVIVGGFNGLYKSIDGGSLFHSSYNGIHDAGSFNNIEVDKNGTLWAIADYTGIYKMEPGENTFTPFIKGDRFGTGFLMGDSLPVIGSSRTRFYDVIKRQWVGELLHPDLVFADYLVKTSDGYFMSTFLDGVFKKNDSPAEWDDFNQGLVSKRIRGLYKNKRKLVVGTEDGLYTRTKGDTEWQKISSAKISTMYVKDDVYLIQDGNGGSYISTDAGLHWKLIEAVKGFFIQSFIIDDGGRIYAVGVTEMFISDDNGQTWISKTIPSNVYESIAVSADRLYLGAVEGEIVSMPRNAVVTTIENPVSCAVRVYPNPATTYINVVSGNSKTIRVHLYSLQGEKVSDEVKFTDEAEIPVGHLNRGIYLLRYIHDDGIAGTRKVILR